MKVKTTLISNNPYQTREDYGDLSGLVASIRKFGLVQPLPVREIDGRYELAFGSRRFRALMKAGLDEVDVEVRKLSNEDMSLMAVCENVHRKDLTPVELAQAYRKAMNATKLSLHAFAETLGESDGKIRDYLSILELPLRILKNQEKYNATELISLGRLNKLSESVRIELENTLENKAVPAHFLRQVVASCESIYASGLPHDKKQDLCYDVISQDYSSLAPENFKDIRTFSDRRVEEELTKYNERLKKTEAARLKAREYRKAGIKTVYHIVHVDQRLEGVRRSITEAELRVQSAIKNDYYKKATKRSQGKFRTAVNKLAKSLEVILNDGEESGR